MNLTVLLDNAAAKFPQRTAVVCERRRLTYRELVERSCRLAKEMLSWGLKSEAHVALLSPNCHFFVEAYFAAVRAGFVVVLVNTRLSLQEIAYILNDSHAEALFYASEYQDKVEKIRADVQGVRFFVSSVSQDDICSVDYDNPGRAKEPSVIMELVGESAPCQIVYTSGTTGRPKGAVLTHGNVIWNFFNTVVAREDPPGEKILVIGPLFHVAALNNQLTVHIGLGGTCSLVGKFDPEQVLSRIEEEKISVLIAAPAVYNLLMQQRTVRRYDTRSIRHLTAGADKLSSETRKRMIKFFGGVNGVNNVYGCTEATATITVLKARDSTRKWESIGKAAPFLEAGIMDHEGKPLPVGEVGEIVCHGPNVMQGYYNRPEETKDALRSSWLHTGDIGYRDEEGFFYIIDRKKDMVVSGGENIYPREVEEILLRHPEIADAAVIGIPDAFWGESVKAFIVRRPGASLDADGIIEYCRLHLASYKKPKFVEFLKEIPRNPAGKALKKLLRERQ